MATQYIVGNTHRLIGNPTKDGAATSWDSVAVIITDPTDAAVSHDCIYNADAGDGSAGWYYDWTIANTPGDWLIRFEGVISGIPIDNQTDDLLTITVKARRG